MSARQYHLSETYRACFFLAGFYRWQAARRFKPVDGLTAELAREVGPWMVNFQRDADAEAHKAAARYYLRACRSIREGRGRPGPPAHD